MLIRPASCVTEDVLGIHAIEEACFSRPWRSLDIACFLGEADTLMLVAEEAGEILGYLGMRTVLDEGHIQNIATLPSARRRGVASALLDTLFDFGKSYRLAVYYLEVRASNLAAQALYSKYGFVETGRRKAYYVAPVEDAILMTRTVKEQP